MSSSFSLQPATLDITCTQGDEFGMSMTWSQNLSGYSWTSQVFESLSSVNAALPQGYNSVGAVAENITVTVSDPDAGIMSLGMNETQTASLSVASRYRWFLRGVAPGDVTRTYVSGNFSVRAP